MNETGKSWVVYLMTVYKSPHGIKAVCEQSEWEEMETARPGHHKLLIAGIANEGEAETLARAVPDDAVPAAPWYRRR